MNRRTVLVTCAVSCSSLAGCTSDNEVESGEAIRISSGRTVVDDETKVCEFDDLPGDAQREFESAMAEDGYYRIAGGSALVSADCYETGAVIEFDGEYYDVSVDAYGG